MNAMEAARLKAYIDTMVTEPAPQGGYIVPNAVYAVQPAPFANQPAPQGGLYCPTHGTPAVMKPAGFRKDGSSYPSFPVCSDPSCRVRPARQNAPQPAQNAPYAPQGVPVVSEGDLPF